MRSHPRLSRFALALAGIVWMLAAPLVAMPTNRRMRRAAGPRGQPKLVDGKWWVWPDGTKIRAVRGGANISFTNLGTATGENTTAKTTGTLSPTGDRLLFFWVGVVDDVTIVEPTVSTTLSGVTLTRIAVTSTTTTRSSFLYRAWSPASPGTGTFTADWGASTMQRILIMVSEAANTYAGGDNGTNAIAQVYPMGTGTLGTSRTEGIQSLRDATNNANAAFWLVGNPSSETITERSGWTKLVQINGVGGNLGNGMMQYLIGEESAKVTSASWTTNSHSNIIHVEVRAADSTVEPGQITWTTLTTGTSGTSAPSITTASVTPDVPKLLVFAVENRRSGTPDTPTITDSLGTLTWSQVTTVKYDTAGTPQNRLTTFVAVIAAGATGTVTATTTNNHTRWNWHLLQGSSTDISGAAAAAIVQSATNNADAGTSISATLNAFADGRNGVLAFLACDTNTNAATWDPGLGFIELNTQTGGTSGSLATEWCYTNDTTADFTRTSAADLAVIAMEVKAEVPTIGASVVGASKAAHRAVDVHARR